MHSGAKERVLKTVSTGQKGLMTHKCIVTGKKKLTYCPDNLHCSFCKAAGHTLSMCLARPTVPSKTEAIPWVDALIAAPAVDLSIYEGLSLPAAHQKLFSLAAEINEGNPWKDSTNKRDEIRKNLGLWKAIGTGPAVLSWHAYGLCLRFQSGATPPPLRFPSVFLTKEEQEFCEQQAEKHLASGKYWIPPKGFPAMLSNQTVQHSITDEGLDKMRACDNLILLNSLLASHSHRMETLKRTVPDIVERFDMLYTHDYSDAYRSIFMHLSALKWLCLLIGDRIIGSRCLPMGLKPATFWFTKINRPILRFFRSLMLKLLNYLDDWVNAASPHRIHEVLFFTSTILAELGFVINMKKQKDPAMVVKALGFLINSFSCEFIIPPQKLVRLKAMVVHMDAEIRNGRSVSHETLNRLLGFAISLKLAVPAIPLFTRPLYQVLDSCVDQRSAVVFTPRALQALRELPLAVVEHGNASFTSHTVSASLMVDTSVSAVGATFSSVFGSPEDAWELTIPLPCKLIGTSSTMRELFGAWVMLERVVPLLVTAAARDPALPRHRTVLYLRVVIDCAGAIYCLLKPGSKHPGQNDIIQRIYTLLARWNVQLVPEWSARELLQFVDDLSKKWENLPLLSEQALLKILRRFPGKPVTLPPPNKIASAILDIRGSSKAKVLVHPVWEAQSWWPILANARHAVLDLGSFSDTFAEKETEQPEWSFQASLILAD